MGKGPNVSVPVVIVVIVIVVAVVAFIGYRATNPQAFSGPPVVKTAKDFGGLGPPPLQQPGAAPKTSNPYGGGLTVPAGGGGQ